MQINNLLNYNDMKYISVIFFIFVSVNLFSQKKNEYNQYMISEVIFESVIDEDSYCAKYFYGNNNCLDKIIKTYRIKDDKYVEIYQLNELSNKIINVLHYKNNKIIKEIEHYYVLNNNRLIEREEYVNYLENYFYKTKMEYNKYLELTRIIKEEGIVKTKEPYKTEYNIIWNNGNICKDILYINNDIEYPITSSFIYNSMNHCINNTNLNFNFLIGTPSFRRIVSNIVFSTEWVGKNTNLVIYSDKNSIKYNDGYNEVRVNNNKIEYICSIRKNILQEKPYGFYHIKYVY